MRTAYRNTLLLVALNTALFYWKAGSFLTTKAFAGRDLVGAYSLIHVFGQAWVTKWFLGAPIFQFYPPGFFGTVNILNTFIGPSNSFKLVVASSLVLLPALVYLSYRKPFGYRMASLAALMSVYITYTGGVRSLLYQTLEVGLVAQMAGLVPMIILPGLLWRETRGSAYLSGLMVAASILMHPFTGAASVLFISIYFAATKDIFRTLAGFMGLSLSGFYWTRAIRDLWYTHPYTGPTAQPLSLPLLFLPFLLIDRSRKAISVGIWAVTLLLLGFVDVAGFQAYRYTLLGTVVTVIGSSFGISKALEMTDLGFKKGIVVFTAFVVVTTGLHSFAPQWESNTDLEGVVPEDGRVIVETRADEMFETYVPQQMIPLKSDATVVNGLYADSSITSPYLLGLEKSFSKNPIDNPIAVKANLSEGQLKKRFNYLNIRHALIRHHSTYQRLGFMKKHASNSQFVLLKHRPSYDHNITNVVTVNGSRKEWNRLNRHIFRNKLQTNIVYTSNSNAIYRLGNYRPEEIVRLAENATTDIRGTIIPESITPRKQPEAIFGLRVNLTKVR